MALEPKVAADLPFDINRPRTPGDKTALLPKLGMMGKSVLDTQFAPKNVDEYLAVLHGQIGDAAMKSHDHLIEAAKALGSPVPEAFSYSTMAFMPDPANYGLMQWPGLNPESLRKLSRENIAAQMIIRARVSDLARYSGLSTHPWKPGWRINMREASGSINTQSKKDIKDAERFIWNCSKNIGDDARERDANQISSFEMFLRSFADDTLTFDGWAIWTDSDSQGRPQAFANLPAGMIRLAVPSRGYKGDRKYFAAMIDETGTPIKPLTRQELTWRVRNVRNDPSVGGYGWSEQEIAIQLMTSLQSAIDLNAKAFTTNSIPNGMLLLKGDYFQQDQIDALMREWTNMKRGVSKLWGMPIMAVPEDGDVEILDFMDMKGSEIRYKDHINLMGGLTCFVYQFPTSRVGLFTSGGSRDNKPSTDASIEIQGTDDPGLPALLLFAENTINEYLLWPNWPNLRFEFLNKNPKEDARAYEARKLARTWGEARAEADLPPLKSLAPKEMKPLAEMMELCPQDPSMSGVFQTVATAMMQSMLGTDDGKDQEVVGARMDSKTDPAGSLAHGHASGVRRDSATEEKTNPPK